MYKVGHVFETCTGQGSTVNGTARPMVFTGWLLSFDVLPRLTHWFRFFFFLICIKMFSTLMTEFLDTPLRSVPNASASLTTASRTNLGLFLQTTNRCMALFTPVLRSWGAWGPQKCWDGRGHWASLQEIQAQWYNQVPPQSPAPSGTTLLNSP